MGTPRHRRLQELTARLTESADTAQIIGLVAHESVIALEAHVGRMSLLTEDGSQFKDAHVVTHPASLLPANVIDAWQTFAPDAPEPVADAIRTRSLIVLESREDRDGRYPDLADREEPSQAWIVSPILLPSRALGVIELRFPSPRRLEDEDRAYIAILTDLCAQALDRAALDEKLRLMKEQGRVMKIEFERMRQQYEAFRAEYKRLMAERAAAKSAVAETNEREDWQRTFLRKMLSEATAGGLHLCYGTGELPQPLTPVGKPVDLAKPGGVRELRHLALSAAKDMGFSAEREFDLEVAVGEAGTNAVSHAGSGLGTISIDPGRRIQVWITDQGPGIALDNIPRATLARGYSTQATLGHGFKIVLQTIDRVYLLTSPAGTTVVLEQDNRADPFW